MPGDELASIDSANTIISVLDGSYQTIGRITEIVQTSPGAGYSESPAVVLYNKFSQGMEVFDYVLRVEPTPGSNFTNGENVIGQTSNTAGRVEFYSSAQGLLYLTRLSMTDEYIDGERVVGEFSGNDTTITKVLERGATFLSPKIGRTGINATVLADTSSGIGFINELQISDSGFGYKQDDEVVMLSEDFPTKLARGVLSLGDGVGIGQGHYKNREGFLSADKYIHDGYFYQEYSYQVLTALPFNNYSDVLRKVLHVAGTEPFGKYVSSSITDITINSECEISLTAE
jgi:hypothetical protein